MLVLGANSENCLPPIPTPAPSTFPQGQVFEAHQNWVCIGCHQSCHDCMKQIQDTCKVAGLMRCLSINRPRIHHNFAMGTRLMTASDFLSWNSTGSKSSHNGCLCKGQGAGLLMVDEEVTSRKEHVGNTYLQISSRGLSNTLSCVWFHINTFYALGSFWYFSPYLW